MIKHLLLFMNLTKIQFIDKIDICFFYIHGNYNFGY